MGGIRSTSDSLRCLSVSSRAPVWGASADHLLKKAIRRSFKSCPRVGGIDGASAPPKPLFCFKSCPRVGGISTRSTTVGGVMQFQVVPPCGGHLGQWKVVGDMPMRFKSCPRVGGIMSKTNYRRPIRVSSRAPVWGASYRRNSSGYDYQVSSRAPVWGASI